MIRRLDLSSEGSAPGGLSWPDSGSEPRNLFAPRTQFRRLRVLVDAEVLDDASMDLGVLTGRQLLTILLHHDLVQLWRYADDGPPSSTPSLVDHSDVFEGWAVVNRADPVQRIWEVVYESSAGNYTSSGVLGNGGDVASSDVDCDVYSHMSKQDAADRRRADWLAAQVAVQGVGTDLFVTERPYLHATTRAALRGATAVTVGEALALTSLYLRAQDQFIISKNHTANRGMFFWVGTRELLNEGWRWFTACVRHSSGEPGDSMLMLASSLLYRFQRSLETRDAVHITLNRPQDHDTQQRALSDLDTILLFMMAAVDVTARVAHRVLELPAGSEYQAGWQKLKKGQWHDKVRQKAPALADVTAEGTTGYHTLRILRLLRNSVHGAALDGTAFSQSGGPTQSLVGIPQRDEDDVLASMEALGGRTAWGVRDAWAGRVLLDPGVVVEQLFSHVIPVLNEILQRTPVERLPHVQLKPEDHGPPPDTGRGLWGDPFDLASRQSIRWQLGL